MKVNLDEKITLQLVKQLASTQLRYWGWRAEDFQGSETAVKQLTEAWATPGAAPPKWTSVLRQSGPPLQRVHL